MDRIQGVLISALFIHGDMTRREIADLLDIPRTTVFDNLEKLRKQGKVEKYRKSNGRIGRPHVYWRVRR